MGCDIHLYTEAFKTVDGVTKWRNVDLYEYDYWEGEYRVKPVSYDRDYDCFAALANVRNRSGLIVPLAEPRGLPENICERTEAHKWGGYEHDGHSASHATLQELYEYADKHSQTKQSGLMSPDQAALVDAGGLPDSYCQGTNIDSFVKREWVRAGSPIAYLLEKLERRAKDVMGWYASGPMPKEQAEKFRIVFFFDN